MTERVAARGAGPTNLVALAVSTQDKAHQRAKITRARDLKDQGTGTPVSVTHSAALSGSAVTV